MNKIIQMVDLKSQYNNIRTEVDNVIQEVLDETAFINGPQVKLFSSELSTYTGAKYVIPCANGTDALQIAMMALDFKPGDEIIVPAFTYIATVEVIALLGLIPVFIDVDEKTFNLNTDELESKITAKTVGIVTVHLYGQCSNMEEILKIAELNSLKVIEDAAQSIGAIYSFANGLKKQAGTMGDVGTTSFFPSKNLGCFGDGGAIFTNDDILADKIKMIANHGQKVKYIHDSIGVNSRLDTIQAAILRVKLKYLDSYSNSRNTVAQKYDISFGKLDKLEIPFRVSYSTHVFHQYTLKLGDSIDREEFKEYLNSNGIPSMVYYPMPLHLQKAYLCYGGEIGQFPIAEKLCSQVLSLPIHTEMDDLQQSYIIEKVLNYFHE